MRSPSSDKEPPGSKAAKMASSSPTLTGGVEKCATPHLDVTFSQWHTVRELKREGDVNINGHELDIGTVVAVSKFDCKPFIEKTSDLIARLEESCVILHENLDVNRKVYGVNTGFGGNADTRTNDLHALQEALIQHQQSGILTKRDLLGDGHVEEGAHSMPTSWVKGAMVVRCNTNLRGHSAVRFQVVDTLLELIRKNMTPIVPLRGSISASGDLQPLAYIVGALQGNPDISVRCGGKGRLRVLNAREAMEEVQRVNWEEEARGVEYHFKEKDREYPPVILEPKEGLALINGTAPSAAVASLAIYEANQLALLAQLITCLSSEVLAANVEWTHSFIAEIRPHPGQAEVSQNQRFFFQGSHFVSGLTNISGDKEGLVQDRYAVRSSSQWIGPLLEDLHQATKQLTIELNSTTDNPVVNLFDRDVHCGANFQAASVTMAMEKTRLCLQMMGKLLFAQTSELINPDLNNGLPPNLAVDDPSLSFCLKGVDINMAAYQSELALLANPVSSHVQSAELHNQSLNSLALVSARYTMQSVDILSMMAASAIYVGLQGVDLRAFHTQFLSGSKEEVETITHTFVTELVDEMKTLNHERILYVLPLAYSDRILSDEELRSLDNELWPVLCKTWYETSRDDANERCEKVVKATVEPMAVYLHRFGLALPCQRWKNALHRVLLDNYRGHRADFMQRPNTVNYLGKGTRTLYRFVRENLGVPFYRGLVENPLSDRNLQEEFGEEDWHGYRAFSPEPAENGRPKKNIGSWISIIFEAVRDGSLCGEVLASMEEFVDGPDLMKGFAGKNEEKKPT